MKKIKFYFVIFMILAIAVTSTGCSKKKPEEINDDPNKFSYWLPLNPITFQSVSTLNEHMGAKRLEEITNMNVEYILPSRELETAQMNLSLYTNEFVADLMRFDFQNMYSGGYDKAVSNGVLQDITPLIEQHAPNFMKFLDEDPQLKIDAYTDSGKIAKFGAVFPQDKENRYKPYYGPVVSKTLLDKTGLDIPVTIDDWEEMLTAFKNLGVTSPLSFVTTNNFDGLYDVFSGAFDISADKKFMVIDDVVKYSPLEEGYKDFLMLFNKWFEAELIDQLLLSTKTELDIVKKMEAGEVGASILHVNNLISDDLIAVPYPKLYEEQQLHFKNHLPSFTEAPSFVAGQTLNPLEIVKWIDYLYSDEGIDEIMWGIKDEEISTYYVDENGKKQYTNIIRDNPDEYKTEAAKRRYMLRDAYVVDVCDPLLEEIQLTGFNAWAEGDYDYDIPQSLNFLDYESTELTYLIIDLVAYVNTMTVRYIAGAEDFSDYDEFLAEIEDLNIDYALEIYQDSYDRYLQKVVNLKEIS